MTNRLTAATITAALLVLTSCGADQDPDAGNQSAATSQESSAPETVEPSSDSADEPSASPSEATDPEESPTSEASETASSAQFTTEPRESEGFPSALSQGDGDQQLIDVRSGIHDGYDRVVFEFSGVGEPGWRVEYVDSAAEIGRGNPIEIAGESILEVNINGPSWLPEEDVSDQVETNEYYERGTGAVFEEVHIQGPFEAHSQYHIGLQEEVPFSVELLSDPARLVVDFQTASD